MGKTTGFLEFERKDLPDRTPAERIKDWNEIHLKLDMEERQRQGARCMDCGVPFCHSGVMMNGMMTGCPLHNLIPEWNDLIYRGDWEGAYRRLAHTAPFPEFTGRVCPALCEGACTCSNSGRAVTVRANECTLIDMAFERGWVKPQPPVSRTGRRVAVIGSGPAGLAAALRLNRLGHSVTVYERDEEPGGLLMYGIPNMKLDKAVVRRRIELLRAEGVEFACSHPVDTAEEAERILAAHDAVVICVGARAPRDLRAPGRELQGVHFAVDYLSEATRALLAGRPAAIDARDKDVIIVGGGDTGTDCVGTALRQGARSATQFEIMAEPPCRRAAGNPWPEYPRVLKVDYAQEEAIALTGHDPRTYLTTVTELMGESRVEAVKTVGVKWERGADGRMTMSPVEGSERVYPAGLVLIAMGFTGMEPAVADAFGLERNARGGVGSESCATSRPGVFAAGDARTGQSLVVRAIADGLKAADACADYLKG